VVVVVVVVVVEVMVWWYSHKNEGKLNAVSICSWP